MSRLTRWLILITTTTAALTLAAVLLHGASLRGTAASSLNTPSPADEKQPALSALLEPDLAKALATAELDARLDIIVEMREQVTLDAFASPRTADLASARRRMVDLMQTTAKRTQVRVRIYLASQQVTGDVVRITPFWIFNGLAVQGARPHVVQAIADRSDVALIRLDHKRQWIEPAHDLSAALDPSSTEWGIQRIRADEVWNNLGIRGDGVVVANMDSGVDWQHPALQASYRGYSLKGFHQHDGNWFDATGSGTLYPMDGHTHGTHTMGTIVGMNGIGVAPGARWIAVRAFDSSGFAPDSWLHAGFQWLLAPAGDPDLAPHIINNSWGNNASARTEFQADVDALRAAGIFVIFSSGNSGPDIGSVGSPASLPGAFAVGASDQDDEIANFSSRGPSPWGEIRPHVVAPGVNVRSTSPGGTYVEKQGTSMAAPHVAGTVALMLSAHPDLSITQTAFILTSTAVPLTHNVPNNHSGYGLVDAYAAVTLAADAGLISGTVSGAGNPIPHATIQAEPIASGPQSVASSDEQGRYQLFLSAGEYDLTASAFGHAPKIVHRLPVTTGVTTLENFALTPLLTGHLWGTVTAPGGGTVEATISVLGTPVTTTSTGGDFDLILPGDNYTIKARALGYQVVTASVTVTAGQSISQNFTLSPTMSLLLVDSGLRYYQSQAFYYRQALDDLSYAYDQRQLKHLPGDLPTLTELLSFDLVLWSVPSDSPSMAGAERLLFDYLVSGGNLLISGQDTAFWDGGGQLILYPYYAKFLHSVFQNDNAPSRQVTCLGDSAFSGISLTIQGNGGADNQTWPDEISVYHPDHASLVCSYENGGGAVIQAGLCNAHRALNLGFGFEAINTAADRADFMARSLDWFASPRTASGVELLRQTDPIQVAPPGGEVTHTFRLRNLNQVGAGDDIQMEIDDADWPVTVLSPTINLSSCVTTLINVRVQVPASAAWDATDVITLTAYYAISPTVSQSQVLVSKAPAPVLLVDDDRWYDQGEIYEDALLSAGLPYDYWDVEPKGIFGAGSPSAERLSWYPLVLWFNGYDWFDPIHSSELDRLTGYLDGGGRLFLSSQEYLYVIGPEPLTRDYFGVIQHSETLSQTKIQGVPGHVLGHGLGLEELTYPFRNWSDSVLPIPGAQVAFRGQHGQSGALTNEGFCTISSPGCRWRTAFFAFPFETMMQQTRETVIARLVGWLSWLGRSDLQAEQTTARVGDTIGYTLTLRNDGPGTVIGAIVSNTLPLGTLLADGPHGGASYTVPDRRITWGGDLAPGAAVTFTYRLTLTSGSAALSPVRNVAEFVLGEQHLHFQREARVRVAAPDLSASYLIMEPKTVAALREVRVTLVLRNDGLADAPSARVDHSLPWTMRLVTGTLSSGGVGLATELPKAGRVLWEGALSVGAPVTLTYRTIALPVLQDAAWVYNAARLEDGLGGAWEKGEWLYVEPHRRYLPIIFKNGAAP